MSELEIKKLREQKGVTLEELASFLQTTEIYLENIEKGIQRRVGPEFLKSIFKMLEIIPEIKAKFEGKTLQAWRKERNITLKDLAAQSGVSIATISKIEKGRSIPTNKTVQQLLNTLKSMPVIHIRMSGKELRQKRKEYKISQKRLAESTGISGSYLSYIEKGNDPTPLLMKSLIENLEVLSVKEQFKKGKQFVIIVERLDKLRQEFGLSWKAVASQSGIRTSTISQLINGKKDWNEEHIEKLEWLFNMSKKEFVKSGILFYNDLYEY